MWHRIIKSKKFKVVILQHTPKTEPLRGEKNSFGQSNVTETGCCDDAIKNHARQLRDMSLYLESIQTPLVTIFHTKKPDKSSDFASA